MIFPSGRSSPNAGSPSEEVVETDKCPHNWKQILTGGAHPTHTYSTVSSSQTQGFKGEIRYAK